MKDLIERQAAIDKAIMIPVARIVTEDKVIWRKAVFIEDIESLPSVDAVPVVRCGECKHMTATGRCTEFADDHIKPNASDFCVCGERRKDG